MIENVVPALVMGFAGGAHCVAMCGGVAGTVCGSSRDPRLVARARYAVAFNVGRVATYALAGGVFGALGAVGMRAAAGAMLPLDVLGLGLRVVAALLLVGLGLHLAGVSRAFAKIEVVGEPLWRRVAPIARRLLPVRSSAHALALGAAWGFVPCGLVYAALALALGAGSAGGGALVMLAFGAGTLPVMTLVATLLAGVAKTLVAGWPRRAAGLVVLVLAGQQIHTLASQLDLETAATAGVRPHACCHPKKP